MALPITALYAALFALFAIALGGAVTAARIKSGISILHGDDLALATRIRRHANFVENVPLALILIGLVESQGASALFLNTVGAGLVIARIAHALGLRHDRLQAPLRIMGGTGTQVVLIACVVQLLFVR